MEKVKEYFKKDQFAKMSDIELEWVEPGRARAIMTIKPHHMNAAGMVQGGAIFTLADFAFAAASNSHGNVAVGINANISFVKAGRTGRLTADAREISSNPKLATYAVEVRDDAGETVALFHGMVYRKKELIVPA